MSFIWVGCNAPDPGTRTCSSLSSPLKGTVQASSRLCGFAFSPLPTMPSAEFSSATRVGCPTLSSRPCWAVQTEDFVSVSMYTESTRSRKEKPIPSRPKGERSWLDSMGSPCSWIRRHCTTANLGSLFLQSKHYSEFDFPLSVCSI